MISYVPSGVSKVVKGADKAVDAIKATDRTIDAAKAGDKAIDAGKSIPNPYGSKGKLDHQEKVQELREHATKELRPGERIEQERKIHVNGSKRRPDVQIIGPDNKTRKVLEAERNPNSARNKRREAEYDQLGIEHETHPLK